MEQLEQEIQAIVARTGLSQVQAAGIAAQQREQALQQARVAAGRATTSTAWEPLSAIDLPTTISRPSSAPPSSAAAWRPAPLVPTEPCPQCAGGGYYKEAVPYNHPNFGKLLPCVCKLREIAAKDSVILRDLADELLKYRDCRLESYGLDRPIEKPLSWGGYTLSVADQRAALRSAHQVASDYVAQPSGWLYLYGPTGSGKTRLAACIANELAARGLRTTYSSVPGLIAYIQAGFEPGADVPAYRRRLALQRVPVLVLDDLGTENVTPFSAAELGDLINQRYNRELPTVFTSNDWFDTLPVRIADRIAELAQIVYVLVESYRRLRKPRRAT